MSKAGCWFVLACCLCTGFSSPARAAEADVRSLGQGVAEQALFRIYQHGMSQFSSASKQFSIEAQSACQAPSAEALLGLRAQFAVVVAAFAQIELYRIGPLLEANRQNRLFYWPDKRRVGERQLRALLANKEAARIDAHDMTEKSVALQGLPALERLLYGASADQHVGAESETPDCPVVVAIAKNIDTMALALEAGWQADQMMVQSLLKPVPGSRYFRSEDEVIRSFVTQILAGTDVILDRKIAALTNEKGHLNSAPLWRSGQTLSMIRANVDSIRALTLDTGLAKAAELEDELSFEFRTADHMLQRLQDLASLTDKQGRLNEEAQSLIRTLSAVVAGIKYTLNDRFTAALGISAGFNSEDGD